MPSSARLLRDALNLPEDDRAEMAFELTASLDGSAANDVEAAWESEVADRIARLNAGTATTRPADEVIADARGWLKQRRA